jgi:hypothetical protein
MNQADKEFLASLRVRALNGEEFNPTLLALYQDLVAQEARESGKFFPSSYITRPLCFSLDSFRCFYIHWIIFFLFYVNLYSFYS